MIRKRLFLFLGTLLLISGACMQDSNRLAGPEDSITPGGLETVASAYGDPPIGCWNFDEGSGDTAADNCDGHDGTVDGAMWGPGVCGSALEFDGSNDAVAMPAGAWLTQLKGTVEAWVKIHPDGMGGRIFSNETAGWANGLHINWGTQLSNNQYINGGIFGGIHSTEGGSHYVEAYIDDVAKGAWHFVAFAWDGDTNSLLVFVDGVTSTVISAHPGIADTGEPLTVGCWQNAGYGSGGWFQGSVDEVKFYDRALSVDELNEHYSSSCSIVEVSLDIKPGSCPNPINPKSKGKLPAALLGSADFDVNDIDVSSLLLEGVAPVKSNIEDVATPADGGGKCECSEAGPDGFADLTLKFKTQDIIGAIGPLSRGEVKSLVITGSLLDGTPFDASDCVVVVGKAQPAICGTNWEEYPNNPIMTDGFSGGSFDAGALRSVSILYDPAEAIYKMWYTGDDVSSPRRARIGYATSSDGISWIPYGPNPVLDLGPSGSFDDWHAYSPVVIKDGSTYKMWYTGDSYAYHYLGYATSTDGINWTKYDGSEYGGSILNWQQEGWNRYTEASSIIKDGNVYKMWFGEYGGSQGVGYATSSDGINWVIEGPVLSIGANGLFDEWRIFFPAVVNTGLQYIMIYVGQDGVEKTQRFGLATSPDGINWTKCPDSPVLPLGNPGDWDDVGHYYPSLLSEAGVLKLWYAGAGGQTVSIGYAESDCAKRGSKQDWPFIAYKD